MSLSTETLLLSPPPAIDRLRHTLFLDLDGTLVDIADKPEQVSLSDDVRAMLRELAAAMNGAVALITGRTIASADSVLDGVFANIAGVHGAERRTPSHEARSNDRTAAVAAALEDATKLITEGRLIADLEDKTRALALHYRSAPEAAEEVRRIGAELAARHGLSMIEGKMVVELTPGARTKGDAVTAFMADPPFAGRTPIAVGDDLTDEDAFKAVRQCGGLAVLVGGARETAAQHGLPDTAAVITWLRTALP